MITLTPSAMRHEPHRHQFLDTETHPIRRGFVYPEVICLQTCYEDRDPEILSAYCTPDAFRQRLVTMLQDSGCRVVMHNGAFDARVLCTADPSLEPLWRQAYASGRVWDTQIMAATIAIATTGTDEYWMDENGKQVRTPMALDDLGAAAGHPCEKTDARTNFNVVAETPVEAWPEEFADYAGNDPAATRAAYYYLLDKAEKMGADLSTVPLRAAQAFALSAATQTGMRTDPEEVERLRLWVDKEMDTKNFPLMVESGILVPAEPPRPYKTNPNKFTKGKNESLKRKELTAHVIKVARENEQPLRLTDKGIKSFRHEYDQHKREVAPNHECIDKHPEWVRADAKTCNVLEPFDPLIAEHVARQKVEKLRSSYIKRFYWDPEREISGGARKGLTGDEIFYVADRIHFNFRPMVSTGRTGSYGGELYPSMNGQNPDPRIRTAFVADPGYILVSTDYGSLELRSAAAMCIQEGFESTLVDLYRQGKDPHAYLGAYLLTVVGGEFQQGDLYDWFQSLKQSDPDKYKLWRTFAKPVGLGAWGGMGARTMMGVAHGAPYKLTWVTLDMCRKAINVWAEAFPESDPYFKMVNSDMRDIAFDEEDEFGDERRKYWYRSKLGMVRRNCAYSVACNGKALQTNSAEGACLTNFNIYSATQTEGNPLYGAQLVDFLHDEDLTQIPIYDDYAKTHAAILEQERIMEESMGMVLEGVPIEVESVAMLRWDKYAAEARTVDGWLVPAPPRAEEVLA